MRKLSILFCLILALAAFCAPSWKKIGLDQTEVTALCPSPSGLFIGTKGHGVFMFQNDTSGPVQSLMATDPDMDTLTVHTLKVFGGGWHVCAGTNHGLLFYFFTMAVPRWMQVTDVPATHVRAIALAQDSILFAATHNNIYRVVDTTQYFSFNTKWDTLNPSAYLPPRSFPSFRSLLTDPENSAALYAGSVFAGMLDAWSGVVRTADLGRTWEEYNWGWELNRPSITTLDAFRPYFMDSTLYLAGSERMGIFSKTRNQRSWSTYDVSLPESGGIHQVYSTYRTRSLWARVHAATDSGVLIYSYPDTDMVFMRMGPGLPAIRVNAVAANRNIDYDSLFAGTADGLYLYAEHDDVKTEIAANGGNMGRISASPNPFTLSTAISFSLSEKQMVGLNIYDISGKRVRQLVPMRPFGKGLHRISWKGLDAQGKTVRSGLYYCRLRTDSNVMTCPVLFAQ
jgi:hypothetical protein